MTRLLAIVSVLLAAGLLAACGGGDDDGGGSKSSPAEFRSDFNALNDRLLALGDDINKTFQGVRGKTDRQIEAEFSDYSGRFDDIQDDYEDLDPPADIKPEYDKLKSAMEVISTDLHTLVDAIKRRDSPATRAATRKFVQDSRLLRDARRALARKTGGTVERQP